VAPFEHLSVRTHNHNKSPAKKKYTYKNSPSEAKVGEAAENSGTGRGLTGKMPKKERKVEPLQKKDCLGLQIFNEPQKKKQNVLQKEKEKRERC